MALIENRYRDNKQLFTTIVFTIPNLFRRFSTFIFFLLSLQLMYLMPNSSYTHSVALEYSSYPINAGQRIYQMITDQINNFGQFIHDLSHFRKENIALRLELNRLKSVEAHSIALIDENKRLKAALKLKAESKYDIISARVLSVATGPYAKSSIIDSGANQGVAVDQIVTHNSIIVGRIIEVSANHSKMRLITDFSSRVPVVTEISRIHGVLAGNNNNSPELRYIEDKQPLQIGENIITSGDGQYFPAGLKVGIITAVSDKTISILPTINPSHLDFVEIIKP